MVRVVREVAHEAGLGAGTARVLEPRGELGAAGAAALGLAVKDLLEAVVDVDRLDDAAPQPVVKERPLPPDVELGGRDRLERAAQRATAAAPIVRDVDVAARLMAAVIVDGAAAAQAEIV